MKTAKESIYEYIQSTMHTNPNGLKTKEIAEALSMLRTNVSALLNQLVKEGRLIKTTTRPVYYKLFEQNTNTYDNSSFCNLVGHNGSLRKAIHLAKAAILYPQKSLHVLLSSHSGCGTTTFAKTMYEFAKEAGKIQNNAPFIKLNCRHYVQNITAINEKLFGQNADLSDSAFAKAKDGVLFLDNADLLDAKQQSYLFNFLETGIITFENKTVSLKCNNLLLIISCLPKNSLEFNRIIPVTIELPELKNRTLQERFELINHFFAVEATNANRTIELTAKALQAVLVSDYNIKKIEFEIKAACANAYVRVINDTTYNINVCLNDFKSQLKLQKLTNELANIIGNQKVFIYDKSSGFQKYPASKNIYGAIKRQYDELNSLGINMMQIDSVLSQHIDNLFSSYSYYESTDDSKNLEQLAKIVDQRVIRLTDDFVQKSEKLLDRKFPSNVFYGLCLHINSLLTKKTTSNRLSNDQVVAIILEHQEEYNASVSFATILQLELGLQLPIHEVALLSMFLIKVDKKEKNPVLLYIMHGNSTATSLKDVTNSLTHCQNAYSYDLKLDICPKVALDEIKKLILEIDCGQGVIVIYDMGSIRAILDTIAEETEVKIRYINIPITLVGIDISRRCLSENDIDAVYHSANLELNQYKKDFETLGNIIITLCHTGEGGAVSLKNYIDGHSKLQIKTIPLAISKRNELLKEVMELQKTYTIHSIVGTYDPKLFGIPFIPISKIFESSPDLLDRLLLFEPVSSKSFDYSEVYKYLGEQFKYASIAKLKTILPPLIDEFSYSYKLSEDQKIGLFMHLACLIERLLGGKKSILNNDCHKIITIFKDEYMFFRNKLKHLEKTFKIIIDDNEIATIIMIVKKL